MNTNSQNTDPILDDSDVALRETVAQLAAASPYMAPPPDLRGKILQATAPKTFRMEDYRKATHDTGRFFRWGFAAAMLFLAAGAYYNLNLRGTLDKANANLAAANRSAQERNVALAAFVNPNVDQITFRENGKVTGKALLDEKTMTAVVILPEGLVPAGKLPQLTVPRDGHDVAYKTVLIIAPPGMLEAPPGKSVDSMLAIKETTPDPKQPKIAGK